MRGRIHVKLLALPYIIVYVERLADGPVLSNAIRFCNNISINEFKILCGKGGATSYVKILTKYYK